MASDSSPRRIHLLSGLIVLFTFLAGAAVGAGLHAQLRGGRPPPAFRGPPGYLRELSLTPDQAKAAEALFDKHRGEVEAVMRESFPKVRAINEQLEGELRAILNPEQAKKLDEIKARHPIGLPPPGPHRGPPPGMRGPPPE